MLADVHGCVEMHTSVSFMHANGYECISEAKACISGKPIGSMGSTAGEHDNRKARKHASTPASQHASKQTSNIIR